MCFILDTHVVDHVNVPRIQFHNVVVIGSAAIGVDLFLGVRQQLGLDSFLRTYCIAGNIGESFILTIWRILRKSPI